MNKSLKFLILTSLATTILTGCSNSGSGDNNNVMPGPQNTNLSVTSNIPGVVASAGTTKSFDWVITATSNTDFSGYQLNFSSLNGALTLVNNGCTGELLAGNSCNITFSYKAPASASNAIYQRPVFSYVNGNNSLSQTGYADAFPMFYTIPQNASEAQSGPASNAITNMAMNDQGCLYIATYNGLSISCDQGKTYSQRTIANGLPANTINAVAVDGQTVYVATVNNGVDANGQALPLSQAAISKDGGNTFTSLPLTSPWPANAGNLSISLDSNHNLHMTSGSTNYVAKLSPSGTLTLSQIPAGTSNIWAIGSSAAGTTYISAQNDSTGNPVIYSSQDNYTTPIASSTAIGFSQLYNPKGTNDLYLIGWSQLSKAPNSNFANITALNAPGANGSGVNSIAASDQFIYAGIMGGYAGANTGLLYSNNNGATFSDITIGNPNNGLATPNIQAIYIPKSDFLLNNTTDNNIYIATQNIYVDNTGGLSTGAIGSTKFTNHNGTNPTPLFANFSNWPYNSITALYTHVNGKQDVVFAGSNTGFEYSFDGGKTFQYVDTSSYGQVNAFATSGTNLLVATSGGLLRYTLSLQKATFVTASQTGTPIYDLTNQDGNHIFAATGNGLLYSSNDGVSFNSMTASYTGATPSSTNWKKVTVDSNGILYAVTEANEIYYAKLDAALPNISLTQANATGLAPGSTPQRLFVSNNVLYFADQQSGLYSTPLTASGPTLPLTPMTGLPANANVVDVYAHTDSAQQTSVYALVDSYNARDPNNGLYVAMNGANSFTQLTPGNATLDSAMVSVIAGTPSAIYVGSFGANPNSLSSPWAPSYTSVGNISKMDLPTN